MSVYDGIIESRGSPAPDYYYWSDPTGSEKVMVPNCGFIVKITDDEICTFVGTEPGT